jgi:hydrogenase expression/formation protein HypC
MCRGVPGRVIERTDDNGRLPSATVEFGRVRRSVCVACVREAVSGDYVIVHARIAMRTKHRLRR